MGANVGAVRWWSAIWVSVLVAGAVSVGGNVGFVGLVVPHMLRPFAGTKHQRLIPAAALAGGVFLVACDVIARLVPVEKRDATRRRHWPDRRPAVSVSLDQAQKRARVCVTAMGTWSVRASGVSVSLGGRQVLHERGSKCGARPSPRAAWPQRRRQEHPAESVGGLDSLPGAVSSSATPTSLPSLPTSARDALPTCLNEAFFAPRFPSKRSSH